MAVDIQATGFVGIAFEATAGTYTAPTKFFPIRSESLRYTDDDIFRRVIRGIADTTGIIPGFYHVEGDIEIEALHDVVPYFLYASRNTVVKTGAGAPWTYTTTPFHSALPTTARTLSITIVRNGIAFGYTGCVVSSMTLGTDGAVLVATFSILGRDETAPAVPSAPAYTTVQPFGGGTYTIGNPTGTTVTDVDSFELSIEDNAVSVNRLTNTRAATFVHFGERNVQLTMSRDFESRAEFDTYKAGTARSVRVLVTNGTHSIQFTTPAAIKDEYTIGGLASQGDLIMADITYVGTYDATTSKAYELVVITSESIA